MPSSALRLAHRLSRLATLLLAGTCAFLMTYVVTSQGTQLLSARLVDWKPKPIPWKYIQPEEIEKGVVIPENTHVMFKLPDEIPDIEREVLLGYQGKKVRYWGYCVPQNDDPAIVKTRTGLPGLLFLSEAERAARAASSSSAPATYNPLSNTPTLEQIQKVTLGAERQPDTGVIRHQLEFFSANTLCYIMSERALPIALDTDNDSVNDSQERLLRTNPKATDTDGDGVWDGVEYRTGTNPTVRDTDSDGLIDGIEDSNFNGRQETSETSPREKDSDNDGLCDGLCEFKLKKQRYFIGEDRNLSGTVDKGETDPLKQDTDKNGTDDFNGVLNCLMGGGKDC